MSRGKSLQVSPLFPYSFYLEPCLVGELQNLSVSSFIKVLTSYACKCMQSKSGGGSIDVRHVWGGWLKSTSETGPAQTACMSVIRPSILLHQTVQTHSYSDTSGSAKQECSSERKFCVVQQESILAPVLLRFNATWSTKLSVGQSQTCKCTFQQPSSMQKSDADVKS